VSIRYDLKPLSAEETAAYVQHRLSVAGGGAAVAFAPKALARLHRFTAGIPRLINLLCDRALLAGYSAHTNRITPAHVDAAASALELERPRVAVRTWLRQRFAAFAAGMTVAGLLTAGGATLWHYREFAAVMVQLVASRP
jgi:general secretion pathway protein A